MPVETKDNGSILCSTDQRKKYGPRLITGWGDDAAITAEVRYGDGCGNGHNSFAITGGIWRPRRRDCEAGGCLHEEIGRVFPELAPFLKWHLYSTDGPMHYIANTVFHAGDRDCWGRRFGEPSQYSYAVRFGDSPVSHHIEKSFWKFLSAYHGQRTFHVAGFEHGGTEEEQRIYGTHYTFEGFGSKWHECPFRSRVEADEFAQAMNNCNVEFVKLATDFSKGKKRELDAARRAAIWPEVTDAELTADNLKEKLAERLPGLLAEFRAAVESFGFVY